VCLHTILIGVIGTICKYHTEPPHRKEKKNYVGSETTPYKGYKGYKKKAFSQEVRLLACPKKTISALGRNIAYCFPGPEKQTHCLSLREKKGEHKSFGERQRVDGRSGKGHVTHPVHHEHYTSHK